MIASDDKNGFGARRPLWITGLSPPDSALVAAPSQLPTTPSSPTPQHRAWGNNLTPELLNFHLPEMSDFRLPLTPRPVVEPWRAVMGDPRGADGNGEAPMNKTYTETPDLKPSTL